MNVDTKANKPKPTLISAKTFDNINKLLNRNNNRLLDNEPTLSINDDYEVFNDRPKSALLRGVKITNLKEGKVNPEPVHLDDDLLGNYLSPHKLQVLTGKKDLKKVKCFEVKVDAEKTAINNLGTLLPNLVQLRFTESKIPTLRNLGSNFKNLKVLWMCRCGLEDLDGLPSLSNISELYLSCNYLKDVSSCSLLQHLSVLDLEYNKIDDISQISFLSLCSNLWNLTLKGNPICTKPDPNEATHSEYDYRQVVLENVGEQLRLLDGVFVKESDPKVNFLEYNEKLFKVKEKADKLEDPEDGDDVKMMTKENSIKFEAGSSLESQGKVVYGNLAKMLRAKRASRNIQVSDTSYEEVDDGLSLDEEIKIMRQDLQKSLKVINSKVKPDVLKIYSDDEDELDIVKIRGNTQQVYETEYQSNNEIRDEEFDDVFNEKNLEKDSFHKRQKSKKILNLKETSRKDDPIIENKEFFDELNPLDLQKSSGDYFSPSSSLEHPSKLFFHKPPECFGVRNKLEKQLTWTKKEKCKEKFKLPSLKTHLKPVEVVNKKATRFSLQDINEAKLKDPETKIILKPPQTAIQPSIKHSII